MQYYKYRFEVKNRPRKGYCLFNMHVADISGEEDGHTWCLCKQTNTRPQQAIVCVS